MTDDLPKITAFPDAEVARNHGSRWSNAELSDDQCRALAVGFYYTYSWAAYADTVALLPEYDDEPETRRERSIEGLHRSWGVDNAADARDTIGALLRGMHAPIFEAVHPLAMEAAKQESKLGMPDVSSEHREFLRTLSKFRRESESGGYDRYYETWWQAIKLGLVDSSLRLVCEIDAVDGSIAWSRPSSADLFAEWRLLVERRTLGMVDDADFKRRATGILLAMPN